MANKVIETKAQAKAAGQVWLNAKFSGGPTTPVLGSMSIEFNGVIDPKTSYVCYQMLTFGTSYEDAVKEWEQALSDEQEIKGTSDVTGT